MKRKSESHHYPSRISVMDIKSGTATRQADAKYPPQRVRLVLAPGVYVMATVHQVPALGVQSNRELLLQRKRSRLGLRLEHGGSLRTALDGARSLYRLDTAVW